MDTACVELKFADGSGDPEEYLRNVTDYPP